MTASARVLIVLVVVTDAWALACIVRRRGRRLRRVLWASVVLALPLAGVAAWLLLGPATLPARERGPHSR